MGSEGKAECYCTSHRECRVCLPDEQRAGGVTHEEARASYAALGFDPDTGPLGVYIVQQADRDRAHAELERQLAAAERDSEKRGDHLTSQIANNKRLRAERDAATSRAETAEGLLRAIATAPRFSCHDEACAAVERLDAVVADARAHLQSLKGGSEP